jgi:hypothetical protein
MFVCRCAFVLSAIIATLTSAVAQLSSLPEIDFSSLSQSDPNPLGARALAIRPDEWKHAETDHFIYHFFHGYVATPVSVEAEFYYRVIVKEAGARSAWRRHQIAHLHF